MMRYRSLLHNFRKNDMIMSDYLAGIKHLYDCLAGCGQQVLLEEQKSVTLNGLPLEYDHLAFIIITSPMPFCLQGITTTLLDAEARQNAHLAQLTVTANLATHNPSFGSSVLSCVGFVSLSFNTAQLAMEYNRGRGRFRGLQPKCEICGKLGHVARQCFYRYEDDGSITYCATNPVHNALSFSTPILPSVMPSLPSTIPTCHSAQSHIASTMAAPYTIGDPIWYLGSGAIAHMTNDVARLTHSQPYNNTVSIPFVLDTTHSSPMAYVSSLSMVLSSVMTHSSPLVV
ncbi:hypothetical protein GOBAR_DD33964 [Gossypium barbadense]|nr:hypothetical protein GOBAR_DD33964 [Gossypium barbadense]